MIGKIIRNLWHNYMEGKQFIPIEEDVKSVKSLAERLKGKNDAETLNNILEWQERNISYWTERGYLDMSLYPFIILGSIIIFTFISIPIFVFLNFLLTKLFILPDVISQLISSCLVILFLIWIIFKANTSLKLVYLVLGSYPVYELVKLLLLKNPTAENISELLNVTIFNWTIFGISLFTLIYLSINYEYFSRNESSLMGKVRKIWCMIGATFKISFTTNEILRYRMGVCRDYAKLTASLLLNIYPKNKIFFLTYWGHVATGIEINNKLYILDQRLPLVTEQTWLNIRNKNKATLLELKKRKNKYYVEYKGKIKRNEKVSKESTELEIHDLIKEVENAFIEKSKEIHYSLKNKAEFYNIDNPIIKESLLRKINSVLQNEFVSHYSKFENVMITQENKDLIVSIKFKR